MARTPAAPPNRRHRGRVNSWFVYRGRGRVLPAGVAQPQITIVGDGKVDGAGDCRSRCGGEDAALGELSIR